MGGPPQRTCFAESSAECSRRLATLRKRKQQSQCTKKAKKAGREPDKVQKKKARCGESSQARYTQGIMRMCILVLIPGYVLSRGLS